MMAKPVRALELHYPMIQFLIIGFVVTDPFLYPSLPKYIIHYLDRSALQKDGLAALDLKSSLMVPHWNLCQCLFDIVACLV